MLTGLANMIEHGSLRGEGLPISYPYMIIYSTNGLDGKIAPAAENFPGNF
jgi:hypothetical protein